MYAWIFRHLPGPLPAKILLSLVLLAGIVYLLMEFAFPWASQYSPLNDSTIESTIESTSRAQGDRP